MRTAPSILLAAAVTLSGCSDTTGPSTGGPGGSEPSSFQVSPSTAFLQPSQSMQFTVAYSGNRHGLAGGPGRAIWHSADESVASVSPGGLVRAVTSGQTRIVATWAGYQASALVIVVAAMTKHDGQLVCMKRTIRAPTPIAQCAQ